MDDPISTAEAEADAAARKGELGQARLLLQQAVEQTPQRHETWVKLAAMCRAAGELDAALAAISRALSIRPLDLSALLIKAMLLEKLGRGEAGEAYGHALAQRIDGAPEPPALHGLLRHAEEQYGLHQQRVLERCTRSVQGAGPFGEEELKRVTRFCSNIARITRPYVQEPTHYNYPCLPPVEFHAREHFPWLSALEAATPDILAEFHALIASEAASLVPYIQYPADVPLRQWQKLNQSKDWTAVHLLQNGERVEQNACHCPKTMALLENLPQPRVPGRSPNAMFSLLAPGARIPPHTGVANTRLVCHLPLIVPPGCAFRVGGETREWRVGEAWVFDDTIEHEAWNESGELRVVFIFDVWAWALSEAERQAVAAIMAGDGAEAAVGL